MATFKNINKTCADKNVHRSNNFKISNCWEVVKVIEYILPTFIRSLLHKPLELTCIEFKMSYETWLNYLRSAEKHSMISGRCRKVFYKFPDGQQMSEEYSMDTGIVQRRAWRKCKQLMGEPEWEIELGETPHPINQCIGDGDVNSANDFTLSESNCSPILTKRITKKNIEWRIRNLPYPIEVYQVSADPEKGSIIVRTTNKKYYKVIPVPELGRCKLLPSQASISTHHQYNTLIITYSKPPLLNEMEAQVLLLLKDVETETDMEDLLQGLLAK